jgi:hypothetical protein
LLAFRLPILRISSLSFWQQTFEDRSFEIEEDLGLTRSDLPCLIIYRTNGDDYDGFALLKLKDSWFPTSIEDEASVNKTMDWLTRLFDNLSESIKMKDQKSAIEDFKMRMTLLARDMNVKKPIFAALKASILPLVNFPIRLITVIPEILEKIASKKLESIAG